MLFTKRWSFITNEESVVAILKVLNYESGIFRYDLAVGCCGWSDVDDKWFVKFDATPKTYVRILRSLTACGTFTPIANPKGNEELYFSRRESE